MEREATISPAEFVIAKFGGLTATAKALGRPVTTVQGWKDRGQIPQSYWTQLLGLGADRGLQLDVSDFLNRHSIRGEVSAA